MHYTSHITHTSLAPRLLLLLLVLLLLLLMLQDPNEKSAGLWVWGLFKEALYPYLLCTFDINRVEVADGGYHVPQVRGG